ncbi:MAG TPA: hypothetical protein VL633_10790 [Bacteroidota bacterium]|nr:hypothetical protein [Bacteroidota bacterium]
MRTNHVVTFVFRIIAMFAFSCLPVLAQMPETDIFVGHVSLTDNGFIIDSLVNMTHRDGYDNQPYFLPDGESFLFTEYLTNQSDIYRCYIRTDSIVRVTDTPESEYSPTIMPDGRSFSVVRVEKDSTQRLWKFPLQGGAPELLLENVKPVGYQAWIDSETVALFVLGDTNTLHIANVRTKGDQRLPGEIGRSIHKVVKGRLVSFVAKALPNQWWISTIEPGADAANRIVRTLPGRDLFAWTPGGEVVMGDSSKLYSWRPGSDVGWKLNSDLSKWGIAEVSRIAFSPKGDRIAVVGIMAPKK